MASPHHIHPKRPKLNVFVSGACYQDVILHVDSFPLEDQKMRANSIEKRRGGNGANVLQVLSQFQGSAGARLATFLVAVLAGAPDDAAPSFIAADLAASLGGVSLAHCVFRGAGFSEPTAWIVATGRTRTIINHTTLPELTHREFCASLAPALAAAARARESVWFHFEGRNVGEMDRMVDWLVAARADAASAASPASAAGVPPQWRPVTAAAALPAAAAPPGLAPELSALLGTRSGSVASAASDSGGGASPVPHVSALVPGISPGVNALGKRESKDAMKFASSSSSSSAVTSLSSLTAPIPAVPAPNVIPPPSATEATTTDSDAQLCTFTISVEFEKPNRPGLDNLLPKADLLFFSKWYAEGRGFPNAPTGFLDNIRRECKPGAILFLTWAVQGCFFLVNETRKPAQTHHVPAPAIFPVDTIGAGDTFAAGILYGLGVMGWDVRTSTEFAVRLATAKCAQVGFDGLAERVF